MATYLYTVEGIYETDKGSGKDFTNFKFQIKLSRFYPEGAGSHILARFLPMLIRNQKNKPLFSKVRHWVITDTVKLDDDFMLEGKAIDSMNEEEIQQLACMYDIFEIPLPSTMSITELREKAILAYLKKVLKVPMKTPEEMLSTAFFKRQEDGTIKLDLQGEQIKVDVIGDYLGKKTEVKKKTLTDFINQAKNTIVNGINSMTEMAENHSKNADNANLNKSSDTSQNKFPSANVLLNQ